MPPYSCAPAGAYFTYLLIMFCTSLSMSGLFRFIGSIAATPVHDQVRRTPSSACALVAQLRPRLKAAAHTVVGCSCCWSWHVHDRMCAVLCCAALCCDMLQAFGSLGILALILTSGFAIIRRE